MKFLSVTPLVISILVGTLLGLMTVGFLRLRRSPTQDSFLGTNDALLLGLLALAAFALGVFLTFILFGF